MANIISRVMERLVVPNNASTVTNVTKRNGLIEINQNIPDVKKSGLKKFSYIMKRSRDEFEYNPVDLYRIENAYHTDSYIRRAVDKYSGLMFKEGWMLAGKGEEAISEIQKRIRIMSHIRGENFEDIVSKLGFDYILMGNAYLLKGRVDASVFKNMKVEGYTDKKPIGGYYVLPAATMSVEVDDYGVVKSYKQNVGGDKEVSFKATDVVHFKYKAPTGSVYGVPIIHNVMDDVLLLRQIEEDVARLINRDLFPIMVYKVGTEDMPATDEEVEDARAKIEGMSLESGVVVPERHNLSFLKSEGAAMNAEPYLKYFRQRVFTGLGMSDSSMGVGESVNRSTSDTQAADLFDTVKEFQRSFASQFQLYVIEELLIEMGYDPINEENEIVTFKFEEIELDAQIKKENHQMMKFLMNAISHQELRVSMGEEPVEDMSDFYYMKIGGGDTSGAANQVGNQNQPANQHGKKTSPKKESIETTLTEKKQLTHEEIVVKLNHELEEMSRIYSNLKEILASDSSSFSDAEEKKREMFFIAPTEELLKKEIHKALSKSSNLAAEYLGLSKALGEATSTATLREANQSLKKIIESIREEKNPEKVSSHFFRVQLLIKEYFKRNYNEVVFKHLTEKEIEMKMISDGNECQSCKKANENEVTAESIPPHHIGCNCFVVKK